jgi:hypothetical protein
LAHIQCHPSPLFNLEEIPVGHKEQPVDYNICSHDGSFVNASYVTLLTDIIPVTSLLSRDGHIESFKQPLKTTVRGFVNEWLDGAKDKEHKNGVFFE